MDKTDGLKALSGPLRTSITTYEIGAFHDTFKTRESARRDPDGGCRGDNEECRLGPKVASQGFRSEFGSLCGKVNGLRTR